MLLRPHSVSGAGMLMLKRLAVRVGAVCAGRRPTATAWWCPCWGSSPSDLCVGAQAFRLSPSGGAARPEAALGELQRPLAQLGAWLARSCLGRRALKQIASVLQTASFAR